VERRPLLAANWKMNPVKAAEAVSLAEAVRDVAAAHAAALDVALFPPFPWLVPVAGVLDGSPLGLGAQDCYWERAGAFTGEVSAAMLAGWCPWMLAGHSERRALFGETDEVVARKALAALENGLGVIVCVGEREDDYLAGRTADVVAGQVRACLGPLVHGALSRVVVAYEPVWAIGTGRNADPDYAGRAMGLIRLVVGEVCGEEIGERMRVLYGGSVKADNVASYVGLADCDGCLVGGASLKADEFGRMIEVVADRKADPSHPGAPPPGARE
jgi:triosephosphate isomerase (TIM)